MAHASTNQMARAARGAAAFATAFEALVERIAQYRLYRRTLAELGGMSRREREDIGLSGKDPRAAAFEAVYGTH